ncbi:MAG TPA: thiamine pyrophosphate-dependent enzyme [Gemmatimonadales bacterium]
MKPHQPRIPLREALAALRDARGDDDVVVAAMGAAREWMTLSSHPLDWIFVPSSMGQATSLGLGLALARPDRRIIVLNGDGSMLMNLGSLVTITSQRPRNLVVIVLDNGVYEVTGAQPTPGSPAGRTGGDGVDFLGFARASGFDSAVRFTDLAAWRNELANLLVRAGPTLVTLDVAPVPGARGPRSPGPAPERARAFMEALEKVE